jgi:hypothetical protein
MRVKTNIKQILGEVPCAAEVYWRLRQPGKPLNLSFKLKKLDERLPALCAVAQAARARYPKGKRVLIFSTLHYWISHATVLGLALAGLGHEVTLAFLPYGRWEKPLPRFDLRRQNLYAKSVLKKTAPLMQTVSLLDLEDRQAKLPQPLREAIENVSLRDVQYTLQVEDVSTQSDLYRLRLARNTSAAHAMLKWMRKHPPQVIVLPNGSILEFGAIFQAAGWLRDKHPDLTIVTYEFGEQHQRIWLAQNSEVMRQETDDLWQARGGKPLTEQQLQQVRELFAARQHANLWENFTRRWQGVPSVGGEQARADLGLDARPIVLLATNVIGDSLTLGRQVFSQSMTEWLRRTLVYFSRRPDVQLVVRIHPGELITKGPSVAEVVHQVLPEVPENIHLVAADAPINTYDLVQIADLGLVYTTTVGMEMAMSGVPVIVAGQTHYRGKGFTYDPQSWQEYCHILESALDSPSSFRPSREQIERAWEYAYRFFFEYPLPFPWHLRHLWKDLDGWTMEQVLSETGQAQFGQTFAVLAGQPINWREVHPLE